MVEYITQLNSPPLEIAQKTNNCNISNISLHYTYCSIYLQREFVIKFNIIICNSFLKLDIYFFYKIRKLYIY